MVRARVFLHVLHRLPRSDDQKSFKLEYLSAGTDQLNAFLVFVNPLILCLSLDFLFGPLADDFFPQTFVTVSW